MDGGSQLPQLSTDVVDVFQGLQFLMTSPSKMLTVCAGFCPLGNKSWEGYFVEIANIWAEEWYSKNDKNTFRMESSIVGSLSRPQGSILNLFISPHPSSLVEIQKHVVFVLITLIHFPPLLLFSHIGSLRAGPSIQRQLIYLIP